MKRQAGVVLCWLGCISGIVTGVAVSFGLVASEPVPIGQSVAGSIVTLLVYGSGLYLLWKQYLEYFIPYAIALFFLSVLSLPSIGWPFVPANFILLIGAALLTIATVSRNMKLWRWYR